TQQGGEPRGKWNSAAHEISVQARQEAPCPDVARALEHTPQDREVIEVTGLAGCLTNPPKGFEIARRAARDYGHAHVSLEVGHQRRLVAGDFDGCCVNGA